MLQMRTGARAWDGVRGAWDRLGASDPGLLRLTLAARGTLSVFLTTILAVAVARSTGLSIVDFASAITLSMMAPFLMREPTQRQRQRTLLVLVLPAAAAAVLTTLLQGHGILGDSCFLLLVFACFLLHPRNPRMIGVGLVVVVATYVDLYLDLPPSTLPWQFLSLMAAVPVIAFACFVALPMRPAATLRRTLAAVQGRAARVLRSARDVPRSSSEQASAHAPLPPALASRLRRDLAALNEAALAADDQLGLLRSSGRDVVRAGLIRLELATARLIGAFTEAAPGPRHAARLELHERRMRRGGLYAMAADGQDVGLRGSLVELGHAMHALNAAARRIEPQAELPPAAPAVPGPLAWRMATRVTLAAGLAMAGGMALSPNRWFWAVMTVYVVFLNARSRGDTILRGVQRVSGTLLGILSGLALATLLSGHPVLETAALLLSIFGMYYLFLASYTAGIFCVTVMLGLLYGMLGADPDTLLLLRLEETAIGAAAGILVAAFVLPTRTRDQVLRSGQGVLNSLVAALAAIRTALAGDAAAAARAEDAAPAALVGDAASAPLVAMRQVDRQVADLRLALAPLTAGRSFLRRSSIERPVPALLDCVHWTRVLAASSTGAAPDPALAAQVAQVEAHVAALAAGTDAPPAAVLPGDPHPALAALDGAVTLLGERLKVGAVAGFALDQ